MPKLQVLSVPFSREVKEQKIFSSARKGKVMYRCSYYQLFLINFDDL